MLALTFWLFFNKKSIDSYMQKELTNDMHRQNAKLINV